jgi:NAD(P)-dependent dehydrogenase (short-subunit alcohol dehydrogenase family)
VSRPLLTRAVDAAMDRSLVLGYTTIGLAVRRALPGWPEDPPADALAGRHVLVTGASSGLGIATVEGLADLGAVVHMLVRDEAKGAGVADRIRGERPGTELRLWRCDVGDLDDVRRFATDFAAEVPQLHAIVHNAGVMPPERTESAQGHELSMAVHVLGPVLMTDLLIEPLSQAHGRVVLVTSGGMYTQSLPVDDPEYREGDYKPATSYARSKRVQVSLLGHLARRWGPRGVSVNAMHPGWADTPGVVESLPGFHKVTKAILRDSTGGADTSVWLVGTQPPPPEGCLWHDRRTRPEHAVPWGHESDEERARMWAWVRDAAGLR